MVIVTIGPPRSGKTTKVKELTTKRPNTMYICADDIREEITGDAGNHNSEEIVWDLVYRRIGEAIIAKKDVIVDVTNANPKHRKKLVAHCNNFNAMVVGLWFDTDPDTCKERNAQCERKVPEWVIDKTFKMLEECPPSKDEGFIELIRFVH